MNVSHANGGIVKKDGLPITTFPAVYYIAEGGFVYLEAVPAPGYTFSRWGGSITATSNPISIFNYDGEKTITAHFTPPSAEMSRIYFPHVASQVGSPPETWETEVCVINTGDQPVSGILKSYRNKGLMASSSITLGPHERWSRTVGEGGFAHPSEIAYMVFESDSDSVAGYAKFYIPGRYRVAIPAAQKTNVSDIIVPHIASDADWWTGISLVNTTSTAKTLTITFDNGEQRQITLGAREHKAFDIAGLFDNQPQPGIQSALISNASGVIGLELSATYSGSQMEGILLTDRTGSTLYYPHVDSDGGWTGIVAYNPSDQACGITVTPYSGRGGVLESSILSLRGKGKYLGVVEDLDLPPQTAWFRIDSTRPLSGFELFGTDDNRQLAAYTAGVGTGAMGGLFPKIEKNGWTDIVLVNTEAATTSLTLVAFNDSGVPVATQALTLGGHAQVVRRPQEIFLQDISSATYIVYASDRNIVGFQLNGSMDGTMLDGLPVLTGN